MVDVGGKKACKNAISNSSSQQQSFHQCRISSEYQRRISDRPLRSIIAIVFSVMGGYIGSQPPRTAAFPGESPLYLDTPIQPRSLWCLLLTAFFCAGEWSSFLDMFRLWWLWGARRLYFPCSSSSRNSQTRSTVRGNESIKAFKKYGLGYGSGRSGLLVFILQRIIWRRGWALGVLGLPPPALLWRPRHKGCMLRCGAPWRKLNS